MTDMTDMTTQAKPEPVMCWFVAQGEVVISEACATEIEAWDICYALDKIKRLQGPFTVIPVRIVPEVE